MAILFSDDTYRAEKIYDTLRRHMPNADLRRYPETGNPGDIDYAIIWRPKPGSLQNLPNLKAIFAISAGVDGIIYDATLPRNVPIFRNTDPGLVTGIMEYVVYHVLRYHRFFHRIEQQQPDHVWQQHPQIRPENRRIGIMGLGAMGRRSAEMLRDMGFDVAGWSRTAKTIPGIKHFYGNDQWPDFLTRTDILVNILPLTDETRGILNAGCFAQLPDGACLINIGRGPHLVEADLLSALESNHLAAATLDVFDTEPLPPEHPFWSHPQITVTPHIASLTDLAAIATNTLNYIHKFESGDTLPSPVDRVLQY